MENSLLNRFINSCQTHAQELFFTEAESGASFTYQQFHEDCKRVACYLDSFYFDSEIIILLGKNSYVYAVYAMSSILLGKTLFPLNPDEDKSILTTFLNKLNAQWVAFADFPEDFKDFRANLIEMKKDIVVPNDFYLKGPEKNQDLIYIPTSATTGQSKIVVQGEEAILSNVDDVISHHQLFKQKVLLTPLPMFHVNALHFSFLGTLFSGGRLVILKNFEPRTCFEVVQKYKVQIVSLIPALLMNIVKNSSQLVSYDISSLDYFVSAAAPLSTGIVKEIERLFGKKIIQGYGLSEAINFSCTLPIEISDALYNKLMIEETFPSIGIALAHNELFILDENLQKLPEGEVGQVAIRGTNLMSGYLNTPKEQCFSGDILLTGDLGYFKKYEDQKFFFISGRKKEIAKVMGESVSLRELDELLYSKNITHFDFFSVCFENTFKGEELGVVCKVEQGEEDQVFLSFQEKTKDLKNNRRPKVVLFVTEQAIRTPSGKAKRTYFKKFFDEYLEKRFLNQAYSKMI